MATRAMQGMDGMSRHSMEGSRGRTDILSRFPFTRVEVKHPASSMLSLEASKSVEADVAWEHNVGDVSATAAAREASSVSKFMVSSTEPPISAPLVVSHVGGCLALPFVERSTRCVLLSLPSFRSGLMMFSLYLIFGDFLM
jgi:hypothetical protein